MFHVGATLREGERAQHTPIFHFLAHARQNKQEEVSSNWDDRRAEPRPRVNITCKKKTHSGHNISSYERLKNGFIRKNLWRSCSALERALNQQSQELSSAPSSIVSLEKSDVCCISGYLIRKEKIQLLWKAVWPFLTKLNRL